MSDGKFIYVRWEYEMDFSHQMESRNDSWGRVFSSSSTRKTCICFFFGGLSSNFTFNPQTVLEMMVVFFCNCIE